MVMGRNECGNNAMVTVQMTVEEYLEMKSRQETKEVTTKQKNLVYGLEGIKTLFGMRNGGESVWAWIIFAMVWISVIVGTCLSFRKMKSRSYLETTCYVLMGLTILIAFKPFYDSCGLEIVLWVIGEGVAYITGAVLYSFKKIPYIHSVFHIFVILGDVCHMIATWKVLRMFVL